MIKALLDKTLYELLKGRRANLAHLRAFGCKCYVHNNHKDALGKFDVKSNVGIFLGYSSQSKAYQVLNKRTNSVEESVHVIFDEQNVLDMVRNLEDIDEIGLAPITNIEGTGYNR